MARKRLLWQLLPSYLLITVIALVAVTWYTSHTLRSFYLDQTREQLEGLAYVFELRLVDRDLMHDPSVVDSLCKTAGAAIDTRLTVIDTTGEVLGDSDGNPALMDNHRIREEFSEALAGQTGHAVRFSRTLRRDLVYVALPLERDGHIIGAVRAAVPARDVSMVVVSIQRQIGLAGLIIALLAAGVSLVVSRRIARPLVELKEGAEQFARGEFSRKLPVTDFEEIGALADAMNNMAIELDDRIKTILEQRNEQEAVLTSMVEGVLAVDSEERLMEFNEAAAGLLNLDPDHSVGQSIQEAIRNPRLQQLIAQIFELQEPVEGEIVINDPKERFLLVNGTILRDSNRRRIGAVVVLNDVTRLRRLESVRQEFVANVSHELKTPITSIKGYVETILDGGMNPEDQHRFLEIIKRQADRLNEIIDDLLQLSRIEQDVDARRIQFEQYSIAELLTKAAQVCEVAARDKQIEINTHADPDLTGQINPPLLEQAIVNLISNAIKYSGAGAIISAAGEIIENELVITVTDTGRGIEAVHLPRLFERFYRVDKARTRTQGGTGLGLAIVKHIMRAHGGRVEVESEFGKGSTFRLCLSRNPDHGLKGHHETAAG
jgi:two-component system phosphate regulon sensor histidine kinase PhoR